jgi:hypothetical protein
MPNRASPDFEQLQIADLREVVVNLRVFAFAAG